MHREHRVNGTAVEKGFSSILEEIWGNSSNELSEMVLFVHITYGF